MYFWHDLVDHDRIGWPGKGQDPEKIFQIIISNIGSQTMFKGADRRERSATAAAAAYSLLFP